MANPASFTSVDQADLEDDARLSDLYVEAVRRGWWPGHAAAVLDFWSLAEKALQEDSYGTPRPPVSLAGEVEGAWSDY